ncbi:unnamed protein product [Adineta steineri]|uniref:SUEL-type lectin domain-containing protein n=1 Tax=Adineta steineri TaxID=433720 RepID=A0A814AX12_9BILA|nr:unnamed protein product [Adineta steineri]CAF3511150.1 unnamed protein product [Adineta steineri]
MMPILFFLILILHKINGKFLLNAESSSIIVLRHIRLSTDNEYYRIRCPYHLNHLTPTLLNYSNGNCFNLYTELINDACINNRSPCRYHAKPVQLNCNDRTYSKYVDITYQCSSSPSKSTRTALSDNDKTSTSPTIEGESILSTSQSPNTITIHALTFPSISSRIEESIGLFLVGLATVFILWLTVCCVWFIRCGHIHEEDDGKCELLAMRLNRKAEIIDFTILSDRKPKIVGNLSGHTNTGGIENVCLHVNPIENRHISSLKITQID